MTKQQSDAFSDLERLRLSTGRIDERPPATKKWPTAAANPKRIKGEFLKGPIPLRWLSAAAKLPGKAPLAASLAIWFEAGRRKSNVVRLTTAILKRFGVNRKAKYRALQRLQAAGLIGVRREPRKNPVVTILELKDDPDAGVECRDVTGTIDLCSDDKVTENESVGET